MSAEFVDTNVVLYSLSDDVTKRRQALVILLDRPVLSLQVLNEAANVMRRKLGFAIPAIRDVLLCWMRESRLHPLAPSTLLSALDVAARYGFSHYDSLIIAAALEAGCTTLYSEDLQHGQLLLDVNVVLDLCAPRVQWYGQANGALVRCAATGGARVVVRGFGSNLTI